MIKIRAAALSDLDAIQQLNHGIMGNNAKYDPDIIIDFDLTDIGKQFFKEALEAENGIFLLAEDKNELVGYINGAPKEAVYRRKKNFEVENLGVIPNYKRQGIGKALFQKLLKMVKTQGYDKISLNVYIKNEEALEFYKALGFKPLDTTLELNI